MLTFFMARMIDIYHAFQGVQACHVDGSLLLPGCKSVDGDTGVMGADIAWSSYLKKASDNVVFRPDFNITLPPYPWQQQPGLETSTHLPCLPRNSTILYWARKNGLLIQPGARPIASISQSWLANVDIIRYNTSDSDVCECSKVAQANTKIWKFMDHMYGMYGTRY